MDPGPLVPRRTFHTIPRVDFPPRSAPTHAHLERCPADLLATDNPFWPSSPLLCWQALCDLYFDLDPKVGRYGGVLREMRTGRCGS